MVSATPTFVGNLAIERELGIPVLLDLLNVVDRRIVSGIITLGLLLGDRAAALSRCLNMAGTGLVGEGMILGNDCDAADGANCSSAQISKGENSTYTLSLSRVGFLGYIPMLQWFRFGPDRCPSFPTPREESLGVHRNSLEISSRRP
jgi:hypothetical protein